MEEKNLTYIPSNEDQDAINDVLEDFITGRIVINRNYNHFNNRTLYQSIDDWTMRWNGYIASQDYFDSVSQSQIFLNFTRNQVISYLSKVALNPPKAKVQAVNKKNNISGVKLAQVCEDLLKYSDDCENAPARFLEEALECTTKGTVIVYEGYAKDVQNVDVPEYFNAETGKIKFKKEKRVNFDNCFRKVVPIEDFFIANPYQPDVQKQPWVIWREVTTYSEGSAEYGHYTNWKYVKPGTYTLLAEPTTFYRNKLQSKLNQTQIEILRYYNRRENEHILLINGVVMYNGPLPFKDGMYPFAKGIFEPYANDFFWGAGFPQKIMGDQDLLNTLWNMMIDKTYGSLLPYGLSSDLDDLIEDQFLAPNKIRKVGDINKWKFDSLPGVTPGEQAMLQFANKFALDNAGNIQGGGSTQSAKGGPATARQVLLAQQESMAKMSFSVGYLEDLERDRTKLRLAHILQFYSIPKIEKITGKRGKEVEQLLYRDIKLNNYTLSDGQKGTKIIKLVGEEAQNSDEQQKLADELSVTEMIGEESGTPTEALAVVVNTFHDYNYDIQIVRNSSYEKNSALEQALAQEYVAFRVQLAQAGVPTDMVELVKFYDESFDIDSERFTPEQTMQPQMGMQQPGQPQGMPPQPGQTNQQLAPQGSMPSLNNLLTG